MNGEQKKHAISSARARPQIGCPDESLDLWAGQEVDRAFVIALARHRQYFLAVMQQMRFINRNVLEERADRGQSSVPASCSVTALGLDERQEPAD